MFDLSFWGWGCVEGQGQANIGKIPDSIARLQAAMTQEDIYRFFNGIRRDAILLSKHPDMPGFTEAQKKELRKG